MDWRKLLQFLLCWCHFSLLKIHLCNQFPAAKGSGYLKVKDLQQEKNKCRHKTYRTSIKPLVIREILSYDCDSDYPKMKRSLAGLA